MDLLIKNDITANEFSTTITIDSLGTETLTEAEEKELLVNFNEKISYKNLTFKKNVKVEGQIPVVTAQEVSDTVVEVTLPTLSNKEIPMNEEFMANYKIDSTKIPSAYVNDVLNTKELVAQAYCIVFADVITNAVQEKMEEIRAKAPMFEGEIIVSV